MEARTDQRRRKVGGGWGKVTTKEAPILGPTEGKATTVSSSSSTISLVDMAITDYLVTDDLTILLGLIAVTVFLLHNLYKPQSLVHPILLGRQSDVGRVRNPG